MKVWVASHAKLVGSPAYIGWIPIVFPLKTDNSGD
jgi:hypothetical protein